ncbi:RING-15 protein [Pleurostoma richardsiae]|uniref:RING-15 protein n=1 Tax=Pleurostoma richardsiae TaxID=41990 RepID=A0AA38RTL5_9PEZI|nr:RING-15 protein [Pleurostoma richardsiae]
MSTSSSLGKSLSVQPSVSHTAVPPVPIPSSSFESNRRPSQVSPLHSHSAPRKGQASRKQHRNQKRPGQRLDDDDAMAELRAVRNASGRRGQTSITHLMNYALPPRPSYHDYQSHPRAYRRNPTWGPGSGYHAADKARYVHANYRFIVSPKGDYSTQAVDADEHLDWSDVMQILASAESQAASCPICLSEPVAPRMAKCGHIFCLPCLIRFMNSSSDDGNGPAPEKKARWKKCPICEDSIYMSDVRPVRFYAGQESPLPKPGDDVVLRLMMRNSNSTLALPKESGAETEISGEVIPWHFAANVLDYARIMRGTRAYMEEQFDREIEEITRQEREDELLFHEDGEWTQKAIRAINSAKEKVQDLGEVEVALKEAASKFANPSQSGQAEHDLYFYTSPPHLYLSPLDIRILKTKYGSFSLFPTTLLPRVEHISTGHVVDDALRKRAKYLGHLPRGCLISFLECDWTDIVPADTLDTFKDEIERRRKRNRDKAAQEERERIQAERVEAAAYQRGTIRRTAQPAEENLTFTFGEASGSPPNQVVNFDEFQPLGAQSTTPPNPRPGFSHLASLSTSPSAQRTVWGTRVIPGSPEQGPREVLPADDGWLKDDQFLESLGAAELAVQMEALGVESPSGATTPVQSGGGGGGKKKKKQKITLMSTGGRRGN